MFGRRPVAVAAAAATASSPGRARSRPANRSSSVTLGPAAGLAASGRCWAGMLPHASHKTIKNEIHAILGFMAS